MHDLDLMRMCRAMIPRPRRPLAATLADRAKPEHLVRSQYIPLEEFWDVLADETERMSNEELRAELALLRIYGPKEYH